ncbi:hypothetical protein OsI_19196 [Oryza sativa Indica Group]|uniref:Uncharacterized protein n=3 Tax=Oryza TaxID=4527 RepID=Q688R9_ORYSJ|nr:hypothetical protein [Oryza sativa Japonica Group]AAV31381.1 hypothetical protein [Oryza sativa Japonica Group]EAY97276.1 hypothetical protein OsI_19196 [Oryza sativa Indica Group]
MACHGVTLERSGALKTNPTGSSAGPPPAPAASASSPLPRQAQGHKVVSLAQLHNKRPPAATGLRLDFDDGGSEHVSMTTTSSASSILSDELATQFDRYKNEMARMFQDHVRIVDVVDRVDSLLAAAGVRLCVFYGGGVAFACLLQTERLRRTAGGRRRRRPRMRRGAAPSWRSVSRGCGRRRQRGTLPSSRGQGGAWKPPAAPDVDEVRPPLLKPPCPSF